MNDSKTKSPGALRRLGAKLSPRRRAQLVLVFLLMIAGAVAEVMALGAVVPFLALVANPERAASHPFLAPVFTMLGWDDSESMLPTATAVFAVLAVVSAALRTLITRVSTNFSFMLGHQMGSEIYRRLLYQPFDKHLQRNSSEVITAMNKVQTVTLAVIQPLMQAFTAAVIGIFIIGALLIIDPVISLAAFAGFGVLYLVLGRAVQSRLKTNGQIIARAATKRVQAVQEGLGGIRDVLIDGTQPLFLRNFNRVDHALRTAQATNVFITQTPRYVVEGAGMVFIALLALFMSSRPGGLVEALPVLGALALGAQRLLPLMQTVYTGRAHFSANLANLEDVLGFMELPVADEFLVDTPTRRLPFESAIEVKDLWFSYNPGQAPVLKGLDFTIRKGTKVGFMGPTGSGKSTTVDILMGLLEPSKGAVLIDGAPLDAQSRIAWRKQVAHVPQSIFLADCSIAENIAFGQDRSAVDLNRVREAAGRAALQEFIEGLPQGYDTIVGERGVRLSGGQRQRIGIARALYKQADVLVFDEATSALDDETESLVMDAIANLGREVTVILIAHRLSTLAVCDEVLRLHQGELAERGDYATVVQGRAIAGLDA